HYLAGATHDLLLDRARPLYRDRAQALGRALERHLPGEYDASDPLGGHNLWLTLRRRVDERALYAEALRAGVGVTPGYTVLAEESQRVSMRLSFSREDEETLDEGVRRLALALRAVLRADRFAATAPISKRPRTPRLEPLAAALPLTLAPGLVPRPGDPPVPLPPH